MANLDKAGTGICLRDENSSSVLMKIDCFTSLVDVDTVKLLDY